MWKKKGLYKDITDVSKITIPFIALVACSVSCAYVSLLFSTNKLHVSHV